MFNGAWATQKRAQGAVVTVQTGNGTYVGYDDGFSALINRPEIARNGFDMIDPQVAAKAGEMLADTMGRPNRAWFPFSDANGKHIWCRFETQFDADLMFCAIWRETDESKWEFRSELIDAAN